MTIFIIIVFTVIILLGIYLHAKVDGYTCLGCGFDGPMEKKLPGNIYIEILLWLLIIVPGIIYTTWRWTGKRTYICPKCYNDKVVENSHPDAVALRQRKSLVKCKYCAEEIKPDAKMCKHCGRDVEPDAVQQSSDFRMNID